MAQEALWESKKGGPRSCFTIFLTPFWRPKSRKMRSKNVFIFDMHFGRRFCRLGIDFASKLGWFGEAKNLVSICILQYILDFGHSRMRLQKSSKNAWISLQQGAKLSPVGPKLLLVGLTLELKRGSWRVQDGLLASKDSGWLRPKPIFALLLAPWGAQANFQSSSAYFCRHFRCPGARGRRSSRREP